MEELFGFSGWDVGLVVFVLLGLLWGVTVWEKDKRRGEEKRNR
jgi:hypothetical protein